MIIVKFCSGIGNQLYQYAVYRLMKKLYPNQIVKADITVFDDYELLNQGNGFSYGFGLKQMFDVDVDIATFDEVKSITHEIMFGKTARMLFPGFVKKYSGNSIVASIRAKLSKHYKTLKNNRISNYPDQAYNGNILYLDENRDYYLNGLWQNQKYLLGVKEELQKELSFNHIVFGAYASSICEQIENSNSVCIHVRRGDFASSRYKNTHDICGMKYYEEALKIVNKEIAKPHYFVFSDDIEYCKAMFVDLDNITYVSSDSYIRTEEEMALISKCKSAIIPNSTFSFWCTWLSDHDNKLVICPQYVVKGQNCWYEFSVPEHWRKVDNLS